MDLGGFFMPETGAANEKAKTLMGAKVPYRGGIPEASLGHRAELHPEAMIQILQKVSESEEYKKLCQAAAMKMVTGLFSDQGHTWRQAAANMKSRAMYEALRKELQGEAGRRLRELVDDTTYRIVTLPSDIGHQVADYVSRESLKGRRASDLEDEIRRMFPDKTQARAELIARTQVSMTSTNMTRQRAERYGMNWYIWRPVGGAAGDGRTRDSHRMMAGVLVNWNDPPAPETLFPGGLLAGKGLLRRPDSKDEQDRV